MHIDITIQGLEELAKQAQDFNESFRKDALIQIVNQAADIVIAEARPHAPVADPNERTPKGHKSGTLQKRGIGRKILRRSSDADSVGVGIGFTKRGWYGIFSELGNSRQSARPFIVPAFERRKAEVLTLIGQVVSKTVSDWQAAGKSGFLKPRSL